VGLAPPSASTFDTSTSRLVGLLAGMLGSALVRFLHEMDECLIVD
jgi:hypothetical protein